MMGGGGGGGGGCCFFGDSPLSFALWDNKVEVFLLLGPIFLTLNKTCYIS